MTRTYRRTNERGVGALIVVVVLGSVLLLMAVTASQSGIGQLTRHLGSLGTVQARALAEGCLEEQLRTFVRTPADTGGTILIPGGSCIISVTGGAPADVLVVAETTDGYATALRASVLIGGSAPSTVTMQHTSFVPVP